MPRYLMKLTRRNASFHLEYNDDGVLVDLKLEISSSTPFEVLKFFFLNVPFMENHLEQYKKQQHVEIREVDQDLSFEAFWNAYDYKVDKKSTCTRIWNALTDVEKVKALAYIPKYNQHLLLTNVGRKYPSTYLNSRVWE